MPAARQHRTLSGQPRGKTCPAKISENLPFVPSRTNPDNFRTAPFCPTLRSFANPDGHGHTPIGVSGCPDRSAGFTYIDVNSRLPRMHDPTCDVSGPPRLSRVRFRPRKDPLPSPRRDPSPLW